MAPARPRSAAGPTVLAAGLSAVAVLGIGLIGSSELTSSSGALAAALQAPVPSLTPPAPVSPPAGLLPVAGPAAGGSGDVGATGDAVGAPGEAQAGAGAAPADAEVLPPVAAAPPDALGGASLALQPPSTLSGATDLVLAGSSTAVVLAVAGPTEEPLTSPLLSPASSDPPAPGPETSEPLVVAGGAIAGEGDPFEVDGVAGEPVGEGAVGGEEPAPADQPTAEGSPGLPGPEQARPEQAQPEHAEPEHAKPEHAKPEHAEPEHAKPEHAKPEHAPPATAGTSSVTPEKSGKSASKTQGKHGTARPPKPTAPAAASKRADAQHRAPQSVREPSAPQGPPSARPAGKGGGDKGRPGGKR